jgi:hypothetical protein
MVAASALRLQLLAQKELWVRKYHGDFATRPLGLYAAPELRGRPDTRLHRMGDGKRCAR